MRKAVIAISSLLMSLQLLASGSALINGKEVKSQDHLHTLLAKQLNFPKFYGKNLDALFEILSSDYSGQTVIKLKHLSFLKARLGPEYTEALIQAILDASEENPKVVLVLE
jgi:ribonuclease inhibitor